MALFDYVSPKAHHSALTFSPLFTFLISFIACLKTSCFLLSVKFQKGNSLGSSFFIKGHKCEVCTASSYAVICVSQEHIS